MGIAADSQMSLKKVISPRRGKEREGNLNEFLRVLRGEKVFAVGKVNAGG
jgi:hypothetical protein